MPKYQPVWVETAEGELLEGWVKQSLAERVLENGIPIQPGEEVGVVLDKRYKNRKLLPLRTQNLWLKLA